MKIYLSWLCAIIWISRHPTKLQIIQKWEKYRIENVSFKDTFDYAFRKLWPTNLTLRKRSVDNMKKELQFAEWKSRAAGYSKWDHKRCENNFDKQKIKLVIRYIQNYQKKKLKGIREQNEYRTSLKLNFTLLAKDQSVVPSKTAKNVKTFIGQEEEEEIFKEKKTAHLALGAMLLLSCVTLT